MSHTKYYIPIGRNCLTSGNLKMFRYRTISLPFDWILMKPSLKGINTVNNLISNNFNAFTENLSYNENNKCFSKNYPNLLFYHHDLIKDDCLIHKFNDRSQKFMKIISDSNNICNFIYNISKSNYENVSEMKEFLNDIQTFLKIMKDKCQFKLIIIVDTDIDFDFQIHDFITKLNLKNVFFTKFFIDRNVHKMYGDHIKFMETLNSINNDVITHYKSYIFNYTSLIDKINMLLNNNYILPYYKDFFKYFKNNIDDNLYMDIKRKYTTQKAIEKVTIDILKYLDFERWIVSKKRMLEFLKNIIQTDKKLSIFYIGSGCGHFPFICKYYNHHVIASNIPYSKTKKYHEGEFYEKICKSFGLHTSYLFVYPFKSIEIKEKYDLITCIMPRWFHKFDLDEVKFFINDVKNNFLTEKGYIFIECNTPNKYDYLQKESVNYQITQNSSFFLIKNNK